MNNDRKRAPQTLVPTCSSVGFPARRSRRGAVASACAVQLDSRSVARGCSCLGRSDPQASCLRGFLLPGLNVSASAAQGGGLPVSWTGYSVRLVDGFG